MITHFLWSNTSETLFHLEIEHFMKVKWQYKFERQRNMWVQLWLNVFTWAKYSSEIRPAHSMQSSRGLQGLATSAHLISIRLINRRFSGELWILAWPSQSLPSLCNTCRSALVRLHSYSMETQYCVSYIGARLLNGTHGFVDAVYELIDMFKVSRHFCRQHHVYNGLPKGSKLIPECWEVERV